jgi:hypothetical protein
VVSSQARGEEMAMAEIETITDVSSLEEIQIAAGKAETVISATASVRQRRIEAETLASGSFHATFYTAPISFERVGTDVRTSEADVPAIEQNTATRMRDIIDANNKAIFQTTQMKRELSFQTRWP